MLTIEKISSFIERLKKGVIILSKKERYSKEGWDSYDELKQKINYIFDDRIVQYKKAKGKTLQKLQTSQKTFNKLVQILNTEGLDIVKWYDQLNNHYTFSTSDKNKSEAEPKQKLKEFGICNIDEFKGITKFADLYNAFSQINTKFINIITKDVTTKSLLVTILNKCYYDVYYQYSSIKYYLEVIKVPLLSFDNLAGMQIECLNTHTCLLNEIKSDVDKIYDIAGSIEDDTTLGTNLNTLSSNIALIFSHIEEKLNNIENNIEKKYKNTMEEINSHIGDYTQDFFQIGKPNIINLAAISSKKHNPIMIMTHLMYFVQFIVNDLTTKEKIKSPEAIFNSIHKSFKSRLEESIITNTQLLHLKSDESPEETDCIQEKSTVLKEYEKIIQDNQNPFCESTIEYFEEFLVAMSDFTFETYLKIRDMLATQKITENLNNEHVLLTILFEICISLYENNEKNELSLESINNGFKMGIDYFSETSNTDHESIQCVKEQSKKYKEEIDKIILTTQENLKEEINKEKMALINILDKLKSFMTHLNIHTENITKISQSIESIYIKFNTKFNTNINSLYQNYENIQNISECVENHKALYRTKIKYSTNFMDESYNVVNSLMDEMVYGVFYEGKVVLNTNINASIHRLRLIAKKEITLNRILLKFCSRQGLDKDKVLSGLLKSSNLGKLLSIKDIDNISPLDFLMAFYVVQVNFLYSEADEYFNILIEFQNVFYNWIERITLSMSKENTFKDLRKLYDEAKDNALRDLAYFDKQNVKNKTLYQTAKAFINNRKYRIVKDKFLSNHITNIYDKYFTQEQKSTSAYKLLMICEHCEKKNKKKEYDAIKATLLTISATAAFSFLTLSGIVGGIAGAVTLLTHTAYMGISNAIYNSHDRENEIKTDFEKIMNGKEKIITENNIIK